LKNDSGWTEGNLDVLSGGLNPVKDLFDVTLFHLEVITVTDCGLKKNSDRVRKLFDARVTKGGKFVEVVFLSGVFD
jgi:hypothetical protein